MEMTMIYCLIKWMLDDGNNDDDSSGGDGNGGIVFHVITIVIFKSFSSGIQGANGWNFARSQGEQ